VLGVAAIATLLAAAITIFYSTFAHSVGNAVTDVREPSTIPIFSGSCVAEGIGGLDRGPRMFCCGGSLVSIALAETLVFFFWLFGGVGA